jgi:hypothetical protein
VRVVYEAAENIFLFLDQQRLPPGNPGTGDTLMATALNGVSLAQWTDPGGFWLSLAGRMSADTLRGLVSRVR